MRHRKVAIAAMAIAAAAGVSGIAAAATSGTSTAASPTASVSQAMIHTQNAMVGGKTETILVDTQGLPLYYYKPDTATKSFVNGELASLWPPLDSTSPTITGTSGKVSVIHDSNGAQVAYNGHLNFPL